MAYGAGQDELEVGGVFLRIFIAQPGWVLRKPREFLVSLLETITELLEKNNPNVSGLTEKQKRTAFDVFTFHSVVLTPAIFTSSLIISGLLQGEALETVTTAAVCLFSTQSQLADQVPPLGHLPRILAALNHKNNSVPKSSIRLLHVLSDNEVRSEMCLSSSLYRFTYYTFVIETKVSSLSLNFTFTGRSLRKTAEKHHGNCQTQLFLCFPAEFVLFLHRDTLTKTVLLLCSCVYAPWLLWRPSDPS